MVGHSTARLPLFNVALNVTKANPLDITLPLHDIMIGSDLTCKIVGTRHQFDDLRRLKQGDRKMLANHVKSEAVWPRGYRCALNASVYEME